MTSVRVVIGINSRIASLFLFCMGQAAPAFADSGPEVDIGGVSGFMNVILALMAVLALVFVLAWGMRRMQGVAGVGSDHVRVITQVALSTRERLMLVEVGGEQILLGVGSGGIRTLHVLQEPIAEVDRPDTRSFRAWLDDHLGQGGRSR